jgi:hypothetical protein
VPNPNSLEVLREPRFADAVEQFDELLSRDRVSFLFGAGTSYCEEMPLMSDLTAAVLASSDVDASGKELLGDVAALFIAGTSNIEDYLSEIGDHLAINERRDNRTGSVNVIPVNGIDYNVDQLRGAITQIKSAIAKQIQECAVPHKLENHRRLIGALHRPRRPGKRLDRTIDYFLLNYDTFIEDALSLERVPFADGIEGGTNGWWRPDVTFSRSDIGARVLKLHGSIDWWQHGEDPLPRRATDRIRAESGDEGQVLIWPASTKYVETQKDPFAQLLRRVHEIINPAESQSQFLAISGYSFGDEHINAEIEAALLHTQGRLTVAVFTNQEVLEGTLLRWHTHPEIAENVIIYGKRGYYHGKTEEISITDLPWWRFENLSRIIAGER